MSCDCAKCKASRAKSPPGYGSEKPVECALCHGTGSVWYPDRGGGYSDPKWKVECYADAALDDFGWNAHRMQRRLVDDFA